MFLERNSEIKRANQCLELILVFLVHNLEIKRANQ